jgi:hypothetical protein
VSLTSCPTSPSRTAPTKRFMNWNAPIRVRMHEMNDVNGLHLCILNVSISKCRSCLIAMVVVTGSKNARLPKQAFGLKPEIQPSLPLRYAVARCSTRANLINIHELHL